MSKAKNRIIARLLLAQIGLAIDINAFGESDIATEDIIDVLGEIEKMCCKIAGKHPINFGETSQIVEYVNKPTPPTQDNEGEG